jgi:hypothetical protein
MKTLQFIGLMILGAVALYGQPPATGTPWWSTTPIDCSSVDNVAAGTSYTISLPGGGTGYYCYVSGTFVWLAAGGGYVTSLRVAGPASLATQAGVAFNYFFYDTNGNDLSIDATSTCSSSPASGSEVSCTLLPNQPAEVDLLGATSNAPGYSAITDGSVFAEFYCPDPTTCASVSPQLIYSAPPTISLSVPIAWDGSQWTQWSTEGIDDGGAHRVSLVIYNQGSTATIYTVRVYDSTGTRVGIGTTNAIPGYSTVTGEAGTYAALLSSIIPTALPSGTFKILVDGGSNSSSVMALQVNGRAIATMQVAYDTAPGPGAGAIPGPALPPSAARTPTTSTPQPMSPQRHR